MNHVVTGFIIKTRQGGLKLKENKIFLLKKIPQRKKKANNNNSNRYMLKELLHSTFSNSPSARPQSIAVT